MPASVPRRLVFAGTPDQVFEQICELNDHCGGIGSLIAMFQGGELPTADCQASLRLFAKEVLPRLQERYPLGRPRTFAAA